MSAFSDLDASDNATASLAYLDDTDLSMSALKAYIVARDVVEDSDRRADRPTLRRLLNDTTDRRGRFHRAATGGLSQCLGSGRAAGRGSTSPSGQG
jgi:hypothetical protein